MPDVVIGNVILTAALAIALLLFVASASGLATIYTLRVRQTLIAGQAEQIAQLLQQVYLIVNTTQIPSNTNYVVKNLGLPNQLDGYPYTLTIKTAKNAAGIVNMTVTITLIGTYGSSSATVLMGQNFALASQPLQSQGTPSLEAQFYKCAGGTSPTQVCSGQPAGEVVLQLEGVIPAG